MLLRGLRARDRGRPGRAVRRRLRRAPAARRAAPARRSRRRSTARARSPRTTRCRSAPRPGRDRRRSTTSSQRADLILGIGTSFTRSLYITPMPAQATLGQIVNDPRDLATGYDVAFGCVGDAKLVLRPAARAARYVGARDAAPARRSRDGDRRLARRVHRAVASAADVRREPDQPLPRDLGADAGRRPDAHRRDARRGAPARSDRRRSGRALVPRGYLGWGKSTQLGTGLGLAMGASLARPDRLSINIMGDVAFGMVGMDFETAVRCQHPDPHDRAQQRADGRLHRVDARRGRALRRQPARRQLRRARRGRSAGTPSGSSAPPICAAGSSACIASVERGPRDAARGR